jgi:hypothetical protein
VFDRAPWNRLKYQLDCPLHSQRLMQPTTLHTLAYPNRPSPRLLDALSLLRPRFSKLALPNGPKRKEQIPLLS